MKNLETILKKEISSLKKKLTKKDNPLAIQIPEGLKTKTTYILDLLKEYNPFLFVDPCYGACDLKDTQAKDLKCKTLIHFGHFPMGKKHKLKTYFIPLEYTLKDQEINYIVETITNNYPNQKINLLTTTQYLKNIKNIKKKLKEKNISLETMQKTERAEKHMVLGCDCSTVVNQKTPFVFVGDGVFHAKNLFLKYNKEILVINPITKTNQTINKNELFIRQRYGVISSLKNAKSFGIIISTKKGQERLSSAKKIHDLLLRSNKKAYFFICEEIKNDSLLGIKVDCFINTACPRITYDDYKNYAKPLITINEAKIIINKEKELKIDQIN